MTTPRWSVNQLGALADEGQTEREAFLSAIQHYLTTQLPQVTPAQQQSLDPTAHQAELAAIGLRLEQFLRTMDGTLWYTLQQRMQEYATALENQFGADFRADALRLATLMPAPEVLPQYTAVRQAVALAQYILRLYNDLQGQFDFATTRFGRRVASHMKYLLYPIRHHLPALRHYWLVEGADVEACEPLTSRAAPVRSIMRYEVDGERGAYTVYVPEAYHTDRTWPLLLTLHGGGGNDEDFLWTWLKYAKSHGYLLVSAKSFGPTWYAWDAPSLFLILEEMQARYRVDPQRILLTGLSDGGSFGYDVGFAFPERFAGLAVVAGILRPHQRTPQTPQLPVYIAHGERDQLFPVEYIRMVATRLQELGHAVTYHEIPAFGHAYPTGENAAILEWFTRITETTS
jgi:phospholipase/carboxylesterase